MKRFSITNVLLFMVLLAFGQLTGTKYIPGDYVSLASAIADLNTQGVGPGGVTIELLAGNPETAPAGGYVITASGTPNSPIIIKGNGNTITSATNLTPGALNDAFFKIIGGDNITIEGFEMVEDPANTTTTAGSNNMTEFGVALFYASSTDGPQNCTIKNNTITLGAAYQNAFGIYANSRHSATSMTTVADITSPSGAFNNLQVLNNTISSVNLGIVLVGSTTAANMATNVEVIGNHITFGRTNSFSGYVSVSGTVNGIVLNNVLNVTVNNNTLLSIGTSTSGTLRGIYHYASGTLPTTGNNYFNYYQGNTITITNGTSSAIYGIHLDNLNAQFTTNVIANTINNLDANVSMTAAVYGIYHQGSALNQFISNNTLNLTPNTSGNVYIIHGGNTIPPNGTQYVTSNYVNLNKTTSGGTVYGYYSFSSSGSTVTKLIENNTFENITLTGATTFYGIYDADGGTPTKTISINIFQNITGGTGAITAIYANYGIHNIFYNIIKTISNGANVTGITAGGTSTTLANVYNNEIHDLVTTAGSITGIVASAGGASATSNIFNNRIHKLSANAASSSVGGISVTAGTTVTVYNNFISELYAPDASNTTQPSIGGIAVLGGSNVSLYYNTVYLDAQSTGTDFSTSALFANTTPNLKLINNILVNNSTANGNGLTVAFRRSEVSLSKYDAQSNNNCFYAGTPSSTNLLYFDGTNSYQNLLAMQAALSGRESLSISELPPFVNTTTSPYDLHIQTTVATGVESGGIPISGIDTDIDFDYRFGSMSYSGTGIAPDMGADEFEGLPSFTCSTPNPGNTIASNTSVCLNEAIDLSLQNSIPGTGITYQWKKSTDGITYTNMPSATSATVNGFVITEPIYIKCEVTCANGPVSVESNPIFVDLTHKILTTTPGAICGAGQATLEATATAGSTINWYDAPNAGNLVATGSPFTTPLINSTTSYYVAAEIITPINATIGTGSLTSNLYESPFYHLYGGLKTQYLIRASELQAAGLSAGNIKSLSFEVVSPGTVYNNFNVRIGTTNNNALTTAFVSGLYSVYFNPSYQPTSGVNTITFTTPFMWDGVSNLVVEFCWSNNNTGGTSTTVKYDNTSYVSQAYYRADNEPASSLCAQATATSTQSKRPMFTFDADLICTSPRVQVIATVGYSDPITITNDTTLCNNDVILLEVTSGQSNYDEFTWTPVDNLFTDAACTVPYTGTSAQQVYMKTNVAGQYQYTCVAFNTLTQCGATDEVTITVLPHASDVTLTADPALICQSGSTTLTVEPTTGYGTATFQFAESNDGTNYTDINGANGFTYTTPNISDTTYYQWTASVGNQVCIQKQITVNISKPAIVSVTPGNICGMGTADLEAQSTSGSSILWYESLSDHYPITTGTNFTTPVLTATEDYYVEAVEPYYQFNVGPVSEAVANLLPYGGYGMYFATTNPVIINSVDIYPSTEGTLNVALINNLSQIVDVRTFTITSSDISNTQKKTLNLDFYVPANVTGWLLYYDLDIYRGGGTYSYPYTSNGFSITGNTVNGNNITGGTRMYFYNWQVSNLCVSSREQVLAIVTPAPAVSITASSNQICVGTTVNLTANSTNNDYVYAWSNGDNGSTITITPASSGTYIVTASDSNTGCVTTDETYIEVYPLPVASATANPTTLICGQTVSLTAGEIYTPDIKSEDFNGSSHVFTAINNSTGGNVAAAAWTLRPNGYVYGGNTFQSPDNSQFIMSNSDAQGNGGTTHTELISPVFSSVGADSIVLEMDHFYRHYSGSTAKVEIYDGTQWNTIQTWTSTQGASNNFSHVVLPISNTYLNISNLQIRFVYDASWGYYWAIDNVKVYLYHANTFSWTSIPVGFTSMDHQTSDNPVVSTQYNVVVTSYQNCTSTATVSVTVNNLPAPTITVNNLCDQSELTASNYSGTLNWSTGESTETIYVTTNSPVTLTYSDGTCISDVATANPVPIQTPNQPFVSDLDACFGETVPAFNATSNYNQFEWYSDAQLTNQIGTGANYQSNETNPGTYTYYVVAVNNGCLSAPEEVTLTIHALPVVSITQNGDTLFSSVSTGNQWYNSQGPIAGATDNYYVVTVEDDYFVVVTDAFGCSSVSESLHVEPTDVAQNEWNNMIAIYPNPARNYTVVSLGKLNHATIQIVNMDGRIISEINATNNKQTLTLKGIASGIYTIKIMAGDKIINKKLIVE